MMMMMMMMVMNREVSLNDVFDLFLVEVNNIIAHNVIDNRAQVRDVVHVVGINYCHTTITVIIFLYLMMIVMMMMIMTITMIMVVMMTMMLLMIPY